MTTLDDVTFDTDALRQFIDPLDKSENSWYNTPTLLEETEGDDVTDQKVPPIYIELTDSENMYVSFGVERENEEIEVLTNEEGTVEVDIVWRDKDIPTVLGVAIKEPRRVSLLFDWIEEALETGLGDRFGDNHYKAHLNQVDA